MAGPAFTGRTHSRRTTAPRASPPSLLQRAGAGHRPQRHGLLSVSRTDQSAAFIPNISHCGDFVELQKKQSPHWGGAGGRPAAEPSHTNDTTFKCQPSLEDHRGGVWQVGKMQGRRKQQRPSFSSLFATTRSKSPQEADRESIISIATGSSTNHVARDAPASLLRDAVGSPPALACTGRCGTSMHFGLSRRASCPFSDHRDRPICRVGVAYWLDFLGSARAPSCSPAGESWAGRLSSSARHLDRVPTPVLPASRASIGLSTLGKPTDCPSETSSFAPIGHPCAPGVTPRMPSVMRPRASWI